MELIRPRLLKVIFHLLDPWLTILAYLLQSVGLINDLFEDKKIEINKKSLEELKELLNSAINDEDYESAAKIRDEISKRK